MVTQLLGVSFSPPIVTFKRISVIETEELNKLHLLH